MQIDGFTQLFAQECICGNVYTLKIECGHPHTSPSQQFMLCNTLIFLIRSTPVIKLCDVRNYSWHRCYCACRMLTRTKVDKMLIHILRMSPTSLSLSLLRSYGQTRTVLNGTGIMIIIVKPVDFCCAFFVCISREPSVIYVPAYIKLPLNCTLQLHGLSYVQRICKFMV